MKNNFKFSTLLMVIIPFVIVLGMFWLFFALAPTFPGVASVEQRGQFGDSFGVLTSLFSGLGFAGVVGTIWMQQRQLNDQASQRKEEVDERRSLFQMETSSRAYNEARELLKDHNNDRTTWIRAGRLLGHARDSAKNVTIHEHKVSLEITQLEYRTFFKELIELKGAEFFYGGELDIDINVAARESTARRDRGGAMFEEQERYLDIASLYAVWEAAQWPPEYKDPLGKRFNFDEFSIVKFTSNGLDEYLTHRSLYISERGVLRPNRATSNA